MDQATSLKAEAPHPVLEVFSLSELDQIRRNIVDGVIWTRELSSDLKTSLNALPRHDVANARFHVATRDLSQRIIDTFRHCDWGIGDAQRWLAEDVGALADRFATILSVRHLSVRVELVRSDACRKFHRDALRARLICTYSGPGTEFGIVDDGGALRDVQTVPTGSPIVMKGKLWPTTPPRTIVHRSPPIEHAGDARLVVVLDEGPSV